MASNNLICNGGFEAGRTSFHSDYVWVDEKDEDGEYSQIGARQYTIGEDASNHNDQWVGLPRRGKYFLIVNGAQDPSKEFWRQVVGVEPGHTYMFTAYACNICEDNDKPYPDLQLTIDGQDRGSSIELKNGGSNYWYRLTHDFTAAMGQQKVSLGLRTKSNAWEGNDLGVDDLSLEEIMMRPPFP